MNEDAHSNITQTLTSFQTFLIIYENPSWAKSANVEEIKRAFKLGTFIEKTIVKFKEKEYLDQYLKLLNIWSKEKGLKIYNEDFYRVANDQILEKLFKFPNIEETTLDIGVRVYTSINPRERFANFLNKLILTSSSVKAITDFVNTALSSKTDLENSIILSRWSQHVTYGQKDALKSEIETALSLYKVEEKLPRLFSILSVKDITNTEKYVQEVILQCLLEKMVDRSLLSKTFWVVLFKTVKHQDIAQVCSAYPAFLEYLFNFIEYIGSMMHKDYDSEVPKWNIDSNLSFCSEITYFDLISLLKVMCGADVIVKEFVFNRLEKTKVHCQTEVWNEITKELQTY